MNHQANIAPPDAPVAVASLEAPAARSRGRIADFVELTKPRLNFLVVITAMVGYYMAAGPGMDLGHWVLLAHLLIGTAVTAGAASALNQYVERHLDARMRRTADRPLPAGRLAPREALGFGLGLTLIGVGYLAAAVNALTATIGALTLLSYVLLYTPMKTRSTLNTVVGAIPGALPPVMGTAACYNAVTPEAVALFTIMFIWQMPHFLAIAVLHRDDYAAAGFKMLPVVDGDLEMTGRQMVLYSTALVPASLVPAMLGMAGWAYVVAAIVLGTGFAAVAAGCAARRTRAEARKLFLASIIYLPLLFAAMMVARRG